MSATIGPSSDGVECKPNARPDLLAPVPSGVRGWRGAEHRSAGGKARVMACLPWRRSKPSCSLRARVAKRRRPLCFNGVKERQKRLAALLRHSYEVPSVTHVPIAREVGQLSIDQSPFLTADEPPPVP